MCLTLTLLTITLSKKWIFSFWSPFFFGCERSYACWQLTAAAKIDGSQVNVLFNSFLVIKDLLHYYMNVKIIEPSMRQIRCSKFLEFFLKIRQLNLCAWGPSLYNLYDTNEVVHDIDIWFCVPLAFTQPNFIFFSFLRHLFIPFSLPLFSILSQLSYMCSANAYYLFQHVCESFFCLLMSFAM